MKIKIKGEGLTLEEQKELHNTVRRIARKRRKAGVGKITYELDFDQKRYVSRPHSPDRTQATD